MTASKKETPVQSTMEPPERVADAQKIELAVYYIQDLPSLIEFYANCKTAYHSGGGPNSIVLEAMKAAEKRLDQLFGMDEV